MKRLKLWIDCALLLLLLVAAGMIVLATGIKVEPIDDEEGAVPTLVDGEVYLCGR